MTLNTRIYVEDGYIVLEEEQEWGTLGEEDYCYHIVRIEIDRDNYMRIRELALKLGWELKKEGGETE